VSESPTAAQLSRIWNELAAHASPPHAGRLTRRVLEAGPNDCYLSLDLPARRQVFTVISATTGPHARAGSRQRLTSGIEMSAHHDPTGRPGLDLALLDAAHVDIFTALVQDLLRTLHENPAAGSGLALVVHRIREWQRMLAGVRPEGLSTQQQRGLFGELHLLRDQVLPAAADLAVAGWTGPDPACQDFQFPHVAVEVKTTPAGQPGVVHIHGERQLDHQQDGALFLVTYVLDGRRGGHGTSLPELVDDLRDRCAGLGSLDMLDLKLTAAGYLQTQAHLYDEPRYVVTRTHVHEVSDGFPRIIPTGLPSGVSGVTYTLNLHAATQFAGEMSQITALLGREP
jgi:Putative  PD-(D/E)XK family member, (DUF4420)